MRVAASGLSCVPHRLSLSVWPASIALSLVELQASSCGRMLADEIGRP